MGFDGAESPCHRSLARARARSELRAEGTLEAGVEAIAARGDEPAQL